MNKIIIGVVVLFVLYVLVFVLIRPIDGKIVEDKPLMASLCEAQWQCGVGDILYQCYSTKRNEEINNPKLMKWEGYNGCDDSTEGYYEREDGYKGIYVIGCSCGGLQ